MISINRLLGEIADPYMDIYSLIKEDLQKGILINISVKMSNIDGLRIIPKSGATYCTASLLTKAMNVLYVDKIKFRKWNRFDLLDFQTNIPCSFIFMDDEIKISLVTKTETRSFNGFAKYFFEDKELNDLIEDLRFKKEDCFKITMRLEKDGDLRCKFEKDFGTNNQLIILKKKCVLAIETILLENQIKDSFSKSDCALFNSFDVISSYGVPKKEILNQISSWISFYKIHPEKIRSLSSITHYEKTLQESSIDYEEELAKLLQKKSL